jgi:hypothetical protein
MFGSGLECTYSVAKWMEVGITDQNCGQLSIDHILFSTNYEYTNYVYRRVQPQY